MSTGHTIPGIASLLSLHGTTALVTGASGGIGSAIAQRLAEAGAAVGVHYRHNEAGAFATVAAITAQGGSAVAIAGTMSDEASCRALVEQIHTALGPIDILVNNAADQSVQTLEQMTHTEWQTMQAANVDAVFLTTQFVAADLIARRQPGAIVNIASIEGMAPAPGHGHYATSKAAVLMFTRAAALEYGQHGIRINAVSPGLINRVGLAADWPSGVQRWLAAAPLGRLGQADDVADAVVFLASPAARWISGANLVVDGGVSARPSW
jgi:NAD(P)-dependent dehydrogenase (short-subunit alcohol dehydrogenase family)